MESIKEWEMVQELLELIDDMNPDQAKFIQDLFDNLDPYLPFLEQQSEGQEKWLNALYQFYCNDDEDSFEEFYELDFPND